MSFLHQPPFLILLLVLQFSFSSAQPDFLRYFCKDTYGNFTKNSTFSTNLNSLFSTITSPNTNSFYNLTTGNGVDQQVNAIPLCWADVSPPDCNSCFSDAAQKIRAACPTQKEAIGWYTNCMLHYSASSSILTTMQYNPGFGTLSMTVALHPNTFKQQLGTLLRQLADTASVGDSRRKYAYGSADFGDGETVYAKVECTPNLSEWNCSKCLEEIINGIPECCGSLEGFFGWASCGITYNNNSQVYNILDDEAPIYIPLPSSPPAPAPFNDAINHNAGAPQGTDGKHSKTTTKIAIAITVPIAVSIALATILCIFLRRKSMLKIVKVGVVASRSTHEAECDDKTLQLHFNTIRAATNDFSYANKLGQGGFGVVYKGTLANGQEIAVKRLSKNSGQGDAEFKNEVLLMTKLQHKNLVRLLGFGLRYDEKLLIYEFVPNASLDHFLFDSIKRAYLDWNTRYKIISGIARGLLYLHEESRLRIIHRDLKASNVLLDEEMNPKIADFGMARLFETDQTHDDTSRIAGTYGYMAPEYALHGLFSAKSDVYSFGILMLEIITGRKNSGFQNGEFVQDLVSSVWRNWRQGTALDIVDPTLSKRSRTEIARCIHMGLLCVQDAEEDRPTMSSVVLMLSSHSITFAVPSCPAFVTRSGAEPVFSVKDRSEGGHL